MSLSPPLFPFLAPTATKYKGQHLHLLFHNIAIINTSYLPLEEACCTAISPEVLMADEVSLQQNTSVLTSELQ